MSPCGLAPGIELPARHLGLRRGELARKNAASGVAIVPALAVSALTLLGLAQDRALPDDKSLLAISNDKLTLGVRTQGGAMARLVLNDDPDKVNPMHTGLGHFVCVDGFGPVSSEERNAGLPGHGEAHRVPWEVVSSEKMNGATTVAFTATLPLVQEKLRRTLRM